MLGKKSTKVFDEVRTNKTYFSVKDSLFCQTTGKGKGETYSFIDGKLTAIYKGERNFNGERVPYWFIEIKDGDESYTISFPYSSGVFKAIVLSLMGQEFINRDTIYRIELYEKDGYTKTNVFADGVRLDWGVTELPPVKKVQIGGKSVIDDTDRMKLISQFVDSISYGLSAPTAQDILRGNQ